MYMIAVVFLRNQDYSPFLYKFSTRCVTKRETTFELHHTKYLAVLDLSRMFSHYSTLSRLEVDCLLCEF